MKIDLKEYTQQGLLLVRDVASLLLNFWKNPKTLTFQHKSDGTPISSADLAAHRRITVGLQSINPDLPILSEEGEWPDYPQRSRWDYYWLVDPLDGTRGFIAGLEQFSINIALINGHQPVLGIICIPVLKTIYYAWQNGGAFKQVDDDTPITLTSTARDPHAPWDLVIGHYSRGRLLTKLLNGRCEFKFLPVNGSLKFGWLAEGRADIYPRLGSISEWDTAAGQCILNESGGAVVDLQGKPLQYNQKASLLNPDFIAVANADWVKTWLTLLNLEL